MRVAILGGSGFIGSHLVQHLVRERWETVVVSRRPAAGADKGSRSVSYVQWDGRSVDGLVSIVKRADAVINLIGEGVADKRWTPERKESILSSRINSASVLCLAIQQAAHKPEVVVQASAVGYYGYKYERKDEVEIDEFSEQGTGFLSEVCKQWEDAILPIENIIPRLAIIRTGIVLGSNSGFIKKQASLFKLGLGGAVGKGSQPFPWIHIDDEVGAIAHLIKDKAASGVYNLVAPNPCTYSAFVKDFGDVLHCPTFLSIPAWFVRLLFGKEMANEVILGGKIVAPRRLVESGYHFKYSLLQDALKSTL
ncbi:TIGR01777 family oxidoreductase [uncultured Acetobacteroides sp.]|uniref:TIGR01777 family oxidoreductase n=1 Tax=uncultured Acetobacteroides sp. TaxID=1760811 RepID=UPI0029F49E9F|nr:TIGR01777 family oxidoreductase [uncultured Acetobacteroides sp.]